MLNYEPLTAIIDGSPSAIVSRLRRSYGKVFTSDVVRHLMKVYGLTITEAELAMLICKGVPTKIIASELNKSQGTVKVQRRSLFLKMRVSCAEQVVSLVFMNAMDT